MALVQNFYNHYHQKNRPFTKLITKNNFTYFYILQFLHLTDMDRFISGKCVLDVGCGVGTLALYFSRVARKVVGSDISSRAIAIAKHAQNQLGFKNVQFVVGELNQKIDQFDFIFCTEVIEHVPDDAAFLGWLRKNLKKDGNLFLTTPSRENIMTAAGLYQKFDREVGHLRRYNRTELHELLKKNKFKVIKMRQVEGPLRNALFTTPLGFLIRFIRGPLIPAFHFFDWLSMRLFGAADIQVLAQKI